MTPGTSSQMHYADLAAALRTRLRIIADRESYARDPQAHLDSLMAASEKITALQQRLPGPVDRRLAHYLERCSYDKALAWLEENSGESDATLQS